MTPGDKLALSVLIPTRDEARNISDCLAAVGFAAERIVYDSLSTDETLELAAAAGAKIVQREFDVFSRHKNWALDNIDFAHDWILIVDADERATAKLAAEIAGIIEDPAAADGYYIARQNIFQGKWIRHAGMYPDWQLRLFRRGRARYEDRIVHEHMIVEGRTGFLRNHFIHHDFKGVERYLERHNHYASLEAVEIHRMLRDAPGAHRIIAGDLSARGPARRRAIKHFAYRRLPLRAFLIFLYMYVWKRGFLDGRIGFRYCLLRAFYEFQVGLKLTELRDPDSPMALQYRADIER